MNFTTDLIINWDLMSRLVAAVFAIIMATIFALIDARRGPDSIYKADALAIVLFLSFLHLFLGFIAIAFFLVKNPKEPTVKGW